MESISLSTAQREDLANFFEMERLPHAQGFVGAYSLDRHQEEFEKSDIIYRSIIGKDNQPLGFVILSLDADQVSLEF